MKRIVIALCIIAALTATTMYTTSLLNKTADELFQSIKSIEDGMDDLPTAELESLSDQLLTQWLESERILSRFVRHTELDNITSELARLPALARYDNRALLAAGLHQVRIQLTDLLSFESPSFSDLV